MPIPVHHLLTLYFFLFIISLRSSLRILSTLSPISYFAWAAGIGQSGTHTLLLSRHAVRKSAEIMFVMRLAHDKHDFSTLYCSICEDLSQYLEKSGGDAAAR